MPLEDEVRSVGAHRKLSIFSLSYLKKAFGYAKISYHKKTE